jgi:hypothetical protein
MSKWLSLREIGREVASHHGLERGLEGRDEESTVLAVLCYIANEISEIKNLATLLNIDRLREIKRTQSSRYQIMLEELDEWIALKEEKHGPVPKRVRSYLSSQWIGAWYKLNSDDAELPTISPSGTVVGICNLNPLKLGRSWEPQFSPRSKVAKDYQQWVSTTRNEAPHDQAVRDLHPLQ